MKRIVRHASEEDLARRDAMSQAQSGYLSLAKEKAKELGLPIKVFRITAESESQLTLFYSCDEKTDVRKLGRALSKLIPKRVELRHTGVRDEAKLVGGIGSCGMELCCSTWLPAFVPVSIKNAKSRDRFLEPP